MNRYTYKNMYTLTGSVELHGARGEKKNYTTGETYHHMHRTHSSTFMILAKIGL